MTMSTRTVRLFLKPLVFAASLAPLVLDAWTVVRRFPDPHPYRLLVTDTGVWTLWFICFTLVLTPVRRLTSWHWLAMFRRMLGLFAFFYATLHTLIYIGYYRIAELDPAVGLVSIAAVAELTSSTARDIISKPFLAIGLAALVVMVPLAATSTSGMIRRLGGRSWRRLHRLVYAAAILSLLHHWWPLADRFRIDTYALLIVLSLAARVAWAVHSRLPRMPGSARSPVETPRATPI